MTQQSSKYSPETPLNADASVTDELFNNLDSLTLSKTFLEQNFVQLDDSSTSTNIAPEKAVYITEIDHDFYLLDYTANTENPTPVPLNAQDIAKSQLVKLPTEELSVNSTAAGSTVKATPSLLQGKKGLLLGLGLGILLATVATRLLVPAETTSKADSTATPDPTESVALAQAVTITEVTTTDISNLLNASGTVAAFERIPVMSQASGLQITEVLARQGEFVERGQVLARLNNRGILAQKTEAEGAVAQARASLDELQAGNRVEEIAQAESRVANAESAIAQAESDLKLVQKRVERNRSLEAEGAITRDSFDEILSQEQVAKSVLAGAKASFNEAKQALAQSKAGSRPQTIARSQAELAQAKGRLAGIEAQLTDTIITAPTSGLIAARDAKVGQITAGEMLFSIIQNGRLELRLRIPETLVGKIKPGQQVQISSNANRDVNLKGKIREIDPLIDDSSRQAVVKVDLPNDTNLKPGMFLQAAINTNTSRGQAVPIEALLPKSDGQATAFVLQSDNTVKARAVKTGEILAGQKVEVIEGLEPGDRIVLKGAAYLKDGDQVKVSKEEV